MDDVVYVYPSASEAQTSFAGLSGATDRLCIGKALGDQLAKAAESSSATKVTFGQPSAGALSISPVGDQSAAGRITIPYTVQGLNPDAVVDLVFVRVDRGIQILSFIGSADAFDPTVEADLTRTAANRLAAQLHVAAPGPATTTTPTTITSTTPRTTPTSTAPAHTTTTPSTPTQLTTTPARTTTTTTPTTTTTTTPSGSQPSASAVAKAEQLLPICRREQPNITLQELEREAESPLGIQC